MIELLVEEGAKIRKKNKMGNCAIKIAELVKAKDAKELLLKLKKKKR